VFDSFAPNDKLLVVQMPLQSPSPSSFEPNILHELAQIKSIQMKHQRWIIT
jgi:hypothetical protein